MFLINQQPQGKAGYEAIVKKRLSEISIKSLHGG